MHIAYLGPASAAILNEHLDFDAPVPFIKAEFSSGTNLLLDFIRKGHFVSVLVLSALTEQISIHKSGHCVVYVIPERKYKYQCLTLYYCEIQLMLANLTDIRPDIVFAQWTYQYARVAIRSKLPYLVVAHDSPWRYALQLRTWGMIYGAIYSQLFVLPFARELSTVSPHMAEDLRKLHFYRHHLAVIPNVVNLRSAKEAGLAPTRRDFHTIIAVSQWSRIKNPKMILRAFAVLHNRHEEWKLIVYGHGFERGGVAKSWADANNVSTANVDFRGFASQADIWRTMTTEADLFLGTTREESFGMVFAEAMLAGLPCVGGRNSGGVPYVLGNGRTGVLCDVTDVTSVVDAVESLAHDLDRRKMLSEEGRHYVLSQFNVSHVAGLYLEEFTRILNERRLR